MGPVVPDGEPAAPALPPWPVVAMFALLCLALFPSLGALTAVLAEPLGIFMTDAAWRALAALGIEASREDNLLLVPSVSLGMRVSNDCVALPAYATLLALELAVGRGAAAKLFGALFAALGFLAVNTFRIFSLALVWIFLPAHFETTHLVLWNVLLFVLVTSFVAARLAFAHRQQQDERVLHGRPQARRTAWIQILRNVQRALTAQ